MYANFCRAHYGFNAYQKVRERAKQLAHDGDLEGEEIWNQVVSKLKNRPSRIGPGSLSIGGRFGFHARVITDPDSRAGHLTTKLLRFDDSG